MQNSTAGQKKVALITGGAIRIGREITLSLSKAGWDVVIHYNSSEAAAHALQEEIRGAGGVAHIAQAELTDNDAVSSLIPTLTQKGVAVDALINNASVFEKDTLSDLTPETWHRHMQINCFAPLQLMRDFAASYKGDAGCIVNITDGLHGWSLSPAFFSYAVSKRALEEATTLLVRALAPRIRINAIAPGAMLQGAQDSDALFEKLRMLLPLQRGGTPEDVVQAVHYLLNAPMVTGEVIRLSGGIHTASQWAPV